MTKPPPDAPDSPVSSTRWNAVYSLVVGFAVAVTGALYLFSSYFAG